ncbi:hypothetical protein DsansV1_C26g0192011 [Dioscorea sansibarensis]
MNGHQSTLTVKNSHLVQSLPNCKEMWSSASVINQGESTNRRAHGIWWLNAEGGAFKDGLLGCVGGFKFHKKAG